MNTMKELTFTGRVFLYHEDFLSITQKAAIISAYKKKGLDVNFRVHTTRPDSGLVSRTRGNEISIKSHKNGG